MKKLVFSMACLATMMFANSLEEIKQNKVLRVGVSSSNPPFAKLDNGNFEGFEINLAKAIAADIFGSDGEVQFVPLTAKDRIPFLQNNTLDIVIATFTVTPDRRKQIDFATPYFSTSIGVLTRKNDKITQFADLNGRKIIVQPGSTAEAYFSNKGMELVHCGKYKECFEMLKNGEGDGWANDNIALMAFAVTDFDTEVNIKSLGAAEFLSIGIAKDNKELLQFVNDEMLKLSKDGFFKKAFEEDINPFYKGTADKKYFLLDDLYNSIF